MSKKLKPSIEQLIQEMPKHKLPQRDLWAGIEHEINSQHLGVDEPRDKRSVQQNVLAIAASVTVIAVIGYMSINSFIQVNSQNIVAQISEQHLEQKQNLLASFEGQVANTDNWLQQLDELDKAAEAIRSALDNEPNNAALLKMLKQVHQQQIVLIERVHSPKWQQI